MRHWLHNYQKLKDALEAICELNHHLLRPDAPHPKPRRTSVIEMRRAQLSFGDGLIAEEVGDLREDWMKHADRVLADEQIVAAVYEALAKRHPKSRSRGRLGTPAEMVLRLLILKHVRNWSYGVLEREVRANLVYRDFTRVGGGEDARRQDHGPLGLGLGARGDQADPREDGEDRPGKRVVRGAQDARGHHGGRDQHPLSDRPSLLGDGVRVLIRTMKKITAIAGAAGATLRDRSRSVKLRVLEIARAARAKGQQSQERLERAYGRLLDSTSRVVGQAKRFSREIAEGVKRSEDRPAAAGAGGPAPELDAMMPRVKQVMSQTESAHLPRRHPHRRQAPQPVRAVDGGHSQGQGGQAQRVRQDGQTAGGRKPDRDRL